MRARGKIDANQTAVVQALRATGMTVWITSQMGNGAPDMVVGWRGLNIMLEIKDGDNVPSAQKLTVAEQNFSDTWAGQICIANSAEGAVLAVIEHWRKWGRA